MSECLVDGVVGEVPADDRGLAYGHGVFETLEVAAGKMPHWIRHWRRLRRGCERLGLPIPEQGVLLGEADRLATGRQRAALKLIITACSSDAGYRMRESGVSRRIVCLRSWPEREVPAEGVSLCTCVTRLPFDPQLAGIKHLNRLHSVLARAEWGDDYAEGLLCDPEGRVVEGTMSNVFWVEGDTLLTPDLSHCGVAGIMRERILDWAEGEGVTTRTESCEISRLFASDGVFVCNSLMGVWPVARIDQRRVPRSRLIARVAAAVTGGIC